MHTSGHHGEWTVQVSGQHSAPQEQVRTTPSFVSHLVCATGLLTHECVSVLCECVLFVCVCVHHCIEIQMQNKSLHMFNSWQDICVLMGVIHVHVLC